MSIESANAQAPSSAEPGRDGVRTLLGRGSIYTAGLLVQLSSSVVTLPIVTRLLPSGEYGIAAVATLVTLLIGGIAGLGQPSILTRIYFATEDGHARARGLVVLGVLPAVALVVALQSVGVVWTPPGIPPAVVRLAVLAAVPSVLSGLTMSFLRSADRPVAFSVASLCAGPGGAACGILLLVASPGASEATWYVLGLGLGHTISAAIGLALVRPFARADMHLSTLRRGIAVGAPLVPYAIAWSFLSLGDRLVIQLYKGAADAGRYHVAYTIGALGLTLVTALAQAWTPIVFAASEERRWHVHRETLAAVHAIAACATTALVLVGPPLLLVATPASYDSASLAPVLVTIALATLPWVIYGSETQVLMWHDRTVALAWVAPLAAFVNITLVAVLVGPFGLTGAALATVAGYGVLAFGVRRVSRTIVPPHPSNRGTIAIWTATLGIAVLGGAAPSTGIWLAARIAMLAVVAVVALRALRRLLQRQPGEVAPVTASA